MGPEREAGWDAGKDLISVLPRSHMEIFPYLHQIQSLVGDRNLFQYLFVGDNVVLLDTGASYTPSEVILPLLAKLGIQPSRLTVAINTHADADHHGGNESLKKAAGQMLLACRRFRPGDDRKS